MTTPTTDHTELRAALREIADVRRRLADDETAAVLAALRGGVRQADIARDLDRSREHIRKIARAGGLDAS